MTWYTVGRQKVSLAAGGDFLVLWLLRGVPTGAEVADHPTLVGATVYHH